MPHPTKQPVHIFWDNSNIYIPAQEVAANREGVFAAKEIRIHFDHLYQLARAGRPVIRSLCVGSVPPEMDTVWKSLRASGVAVELFERGADSGAEQGVDQCLQVHMLRALADADEPGVAVLLTGDGAGYDSGAGFHADLERMHKRGWGVEVLSWDHSCNRRLKAWAQTNGVFIALDKHFEQVTFRAGIRQERMVSLTHRGRAIPRVTQ
ncbi:NYN domain-containing protein [Chromobacterium phragmitis]|nr:NYN domain-containing protein [Chromobacterium phragmitis]